MEEQCAETEMTILNQKISKEMNPEGNFYDLGFNDSEINDLLTTYSKITSMNAWTMLGRRDVPGDWGFVTPKHIDPEVTDFLNSMKELNIESLGFVMRQMEFIAKKGWYNFVVERRDIAIPRNRLKAEIPV